MDSDKIRSVCAWCDREMFHNKDTGETKMGAVLPGHDKMRNVSHGLCPECAKKMLGNKFGEWIINRMSRID